MLLSAHPRSHPYWQHLDAIFASLKKYDCKGIQEKVRDVGPNNMSKFDSTISELNIALLLCRNGKRVTLLPDDYLPGKTPDMHVEDELGEHYVEVSRLSDDGTIGLMHDEINKSLDSVGLDFRVDVSLSRLLSKPAVGFRERREKDRIAHEVLEKFGETLHAYAKEFPPLPFA